MFNCNTCERFPSDRTGFGKNRWASLVFWLQLQALRERRCSTSHASNIHLWRHIIERELNRCSLPPSVSQFTTRRSGHSSVLVITLWTSTITAKTNLQAECSKRGEHIPDGIIFRPLCLLFFFLSLLLPSLKTLFVWHKGFSVTTGTWGPLTRPKQGCYLSQTDLCRISRLPLLWNLSRSLRFGYEAK